jgi:hypothetical protein
MSDHPNNLWIALVESNKSRARVYLEYYRAIERRFGQAVAIQICKEAIYSWGRGLAAGLQAHAPDDFEGLARSFAFAPDSGAMFQPRIDRCDKEGLDVQFETCPLKSAWLDAGMGESEVALFCQMASAADHGTLEAAGFSVSIDTWQPGKTGCCTLRIRKP